MTAVVGLAASGLALLGFAPTSTPTVLAQELPAASPVVVGVLDTGIAAHPDLGWRITQAGAGQPGGVVLPGYDFVSDAWSAADGDGWDADPSDQGDGVKPRELADHPDCRTRVSSWHGTNVAGTIAAQGNEERPGVGIAPDSRILPVRIMSRCGGNTADVAAGLLWAVGEPVPGVPDNPHPARIVNVSLSGAATTCPRPLQTAIDIARERGALVVTAAGSSARDTAGATPANCSGVLVVASTDKYGRRSPTSNYGEEVTLSALGGDMSTGERNGILTTTNTGRYRPRKADYGYYQGSSAAAARVSGALALLAGRYPQASASELQAMVMSNLVPFVPGQCDPRDGACGAGILDLEGILQMG